MDFDPNDPNAMVNAREAEEACESLLQMFAARYAMVTMQELGISQDKAREVMLKAWDAFHAMLDEGARRHEAGLCGCPNHDNVPEKVKNFAELTKVTITDEMLAAWLQA